MNFSITQKELGGQIAKFVIAGSINTGVDFATLNGLFVFFPAKTPHDYMIIKTISFLGGLLCSYLLNTYWVFKNGNKKTMQQKLRFIVVSGIGFILNITVATFVFASLSGSSYSNSQIYGNIGALAGTLVGLIWNFAGYKFFVFKSHA